MTTRPRTLVAAVAAASLTVGMAVTTQTAVAAPPGWNMPAPVVTRAALDPALVAGRGADVAFLEQEAENAVTNGTVIGPGREAYTIEAEASGRSAVRLTPGQYVEFTLPAAANALTVRYSIPDAPDGGGLTAPLTVQAGPHATTMQLTSQYSYLYNQYPFTNDPDAGLLHPDWWLAECACVPAATPPAFEPSAPFRPMKFYDEQRLLLHKTYKAGDKVRLTAAPDVPWTVIDLVDTELVGKPVVLKKAVNVVDFGADPTGRRDSADAFDAAIAVAQRSGKVVYLPQGEFRVERHIVVDSVTIQGAGNWYTKVFGSEVALAEPAADGSTHTGVGFYGKDAAEGGSSDVHLSGFSIVGDVRERIDTDQVNAIGGAFHDSSFSDLYIQHTKVGMWFDGPMSNVTVERNIIVDQIADALNFHIGVTDSVARHNFVRNSGDDGLAMWAEAKGGTTLTNARNTFERNTVQTPNLANGIAVYGGTDNAVAGNLVADTIREGSALHAGSRFGAHPFAGALTFRDNTTVRAGTRELNWNIGLGSLWVYALEGSISGIHVTGDHYLDSTYNAIMLVSEWGVKDLYSMTDVSFADVRVDGAGTSVLSARVKGGASFQNVDARGVGAVGINNCGSFGFPPTGSEFSVADLGGNDGGGTTGPWMASWELPNTITCDDRPPVVAPPAPSPWP
ncbi:right-handed parallel beta-helix repeat-containing protein [Microbacterium sp. NEAU-LLC]|uniref:Right-handed parallel beta-helix repeat-containing protein n=1 Tax=Microbacterium helvum TaxID=2773713 RepID=A0ABR8NS00_9MICO|nr:glycosyl hydrolase family 28-related protein [Microbacterium helvum]MBD3942502.1 right-handed parallel beta-helix repeat-containing protein [Microbacterium helvum]